MLPAVPLFFVGCNTPLCPPLGFQPPPPAPPPPEPLALNAPSEEVCGTSGGRPEKLLIAPDELSALPLPTEVEALPKPEAGEREIL